MAPRASSTIRQVNVTIREAIDSDAAALASLLGELGYPTEPSTVPGRLERMRVEGGQWTLVAEVDGAVVGTATVMIRHMLSRDAPFGRVTTVVVSESSRSRGIGAALIGRAEEICREAGCGAIEVTSAAQRTRAHEFYMRLGFQDRPKRFIKQL